MEATDNDKWEVLEIFCDILNKNRGIWRVSRDNRKGLSPFRYLLFLITSLSLHLFLQSVFKSSLGVRTNYMYACRLWARREGIFFINYYRRRSRGMQLWNWALWKQKGGKGMDPTASRRADDWGQGWEQGERKDMGWSVLRVRERMTQQIVTRKSVLLRGYNSQHTLHFAALKICTVAFSYH